MRKPAKNATIGVHQIFTSGLLIRSTVYWHCMPWWSSLCINILFACTCCVRLFCHTALQSHLIKPQLEDNGCVSHSASCAVPCKCVLCRVVKCGAVLCCAVLHCCDTCHFPSLPSLTFMTSTCRSSWRVGVTLTASSTWFSSCFSGISVSAAIKRSSQRICSHRKEVNWKMEISEGIKNSERGVVDRRKQRRNREAGASM